MKTKFADHCDDCKKSLHVHLSYFKGCSSLTGKIRLWCEQCLPRAKKEQNENQNPKRND